MKSTVVEHFDIIRPCEVRLLARRYGKGMTTKQIAAKSGLSIKTVVSLSRRRTWGDVRVRVAQAFAMACGHDLLRPRRNLQYMARFAKVGRGFSHLDEGGKRRLLNILTQ